MLECNHYTKITVVSCLTSQVFESVLNEKPLMKGDKIIKEVQNGGQVVAIQDSGPIIRDWVSLHFTVPYKKKVKETVWQLGNHILLLCFVLQQNKSLTWKLTYPKGSVEECISWMANRDC